MATKKKTAKRKTTKRQPSKPIATSMITLEYSANNSGGSWWLGDGDWRELEEAGWKVEWCKDDKKMFLDRDKERWLGALATRASKQFETADQGIKEWETITGQDPWAEGCNCCGKPHNFSYKDAQGNTHYASIQTQSSFGGWN